MRPRRASTRGSSLCFDGSSKKAVRAVPRRKRAETALRIEQRLGSHPRTEVRRQCLVSANEPRAGMRGQRRGDHLLVFLRLERTGGIHEPSAGRELRQAVAHERFLFFRQRAQIVWPEPPADFRIPRQRSRPGAGRIYKNPIKPGGKRKRLRSIQRHKVHDFRP